jgi:hypothetical protein
MKKWKLLCITTEASSERHSIALNNSLVPDTEFAATFLDPPGVAEFLQTLLVLIAKR